ncbi:hypothetical protein [Methanobrevibacter sp.]
MFFIQTIQLLKKPIKIHLFPSSFIVNGEIKHLVLNAVYFDLLHRAYTPV